MILGRLIKIQNKSLEGFGKNQREKRQTGLSCNLEFSICKKCVSFLMKNLSRFSKQFLIIFFDIPAFYQNREY